MERPKRVLTKPFRYQTTSSEDERPQRLSKRVCPSTMTSAEIEDDIDDIRRILEDQAKDKNDNIVFSQPEKQHSKDYPQISTNAPHIYISTSTHIYYIRNPSHFTYIHSQS